MAGRQDKPYNHLGYLLTVISNHGARRKPECTTALLSCTNLKLDSKNYVAGIYKP